MEPAELELRQTFVAEARDHLDELEGALIALETHPDDRELLQQVFRVTHTLKGSAGSLGLTELAGLGHVLEDVLADLERRGAPATRSVCSLLLEGADAARQMLPDVLTGIDRLPPAVEGLLQRLGGQGHALRDPGKTTEGARASRGSALAGEAHVRSVRVDVVKLDRMADLIGEIAVGRAQISRRIRELGGPAAALLDDIEQNDRLYTELDDLVRRVRMVPIRPWLQHYARAVRDVARTHGKEARLVVEDGNVEVDIAVLERVSDALTHLIRNAIDHGIEPPERRREQGKDPVGTITLSAWYKGGGIALRITDDGAGLSRARIAAQARAHGLALDPEELSINRLWRLVFEPGFSTAASVSELSGRGMGLTVVRQQIETLRGSIRIESAEGAFSSFTIRLPLTLASIEGLSVEAGGERFVIPLETVVECIDLPDGALAADRTSVLNLRGRALPCVRLRDLVGLVGGPGARRQSVVVIGYDEGLGGIVVDALHGTSRTVIKPLSWLFNESLGIAGSTVLGDGRVALILDVATLLGDVAKRPPRTQPRAAG